MLNSAMICKLQCQNVTNFSFIKKFQELPFITRHLKDSERKEYGKFDKNENGRISESKMAEKVLSLCSIG